jgi:hypothetical protein
LLLTFTFIMYLLEFIFRTGSTETDIRHSLAEFAEDIAVNALEGDPGDCSYEYTLRMRAKDPTLVFDVCAQFGRIKSVKIDEP